MNSILTVNNNKIKCQKFTPDNLVEEMLDLADYKTGLIGKTILENSFGTGNILKCIVQRYIKSAIEDGYSPEEISTGLGRDICGIELDPDLYENCIHELDLLVKKYSIPAVKWNLFNENALTLDFNYSFDFIIGNPPYISYRDIDSESRAILREKFSSCNVGKFDYCYAFIEMAINLLSATGKLVQLIPNNIYKNVFGKNLRNLLRNHIAFIYDFPNQKIFDKTLTSVSIFLYDKAVESDDIIYINETQSLRKVLHRNQLGDKWIFENPPLVPRERIRFGDVFNASISIATLLNTAFLVDKETIQKENIEPAVLRAAASPRILHYKKEKFIIFPYSYGNNGLVRYTEKEFTTRFPNATIHLKQYREDLDLRKNDLNALWFEYGRSQALSHLNTEKLLLSTVITNQVELYKIDAETVPYSGVYITKKSDAYSLDDAMLILRNQDFMDYARNIGISVNGKSIRITCKDINNYEFLGRE